MKSVSIGLALGLLLLQGCDDGGDNPGDGGEGGVPSAVMPSLDCTDDEASLYAVPDELPDGRGDILRCVDDGIVTTEEMNERLASIETDGLTDEGVDPASDTHVYRVLYRTERGDGTPGYSVALVYLPVTPLSEELPLVLIARGSRGQAPECAPSKFTPGPQMTDSSRDGRYIHDDYEPLAWPLAARGFAVIATDSAGYAGFGAEGNPPSVYAGVQDMGKSFLDSAHALKKLVPERTSDKVVMVGLSQGGHTILGSLQVANEYPAPGPIEGAALYAPLWFAQRAWGVALSEAAETIGGIRLDNSSAIPVSMWYHYTHAEMYDGPGEGIKLFRPEVQDAVQTFMDEVCWSASYSILTDTGAEVASDLFSQELVEAVGGPAFNRSCDNSPDQELCNKWMERYRADHPTLTGDAAQVPLLVAYGLQDTTVNPERLQCGLDKLAMSDNSVELCVDPDAGHGSSVIALSDYVNAWLENKALGTPIEQECPSTKLPGGLECDALLPND